MDGIPALDLWDFVVELLHSTSEIQRKMRGNLLHGHTIKQTHQLPKDDSNSADVLHS